MRPLTTLRTTVLGALGVVVLAAAVGSPGAAAAGTAAIEAPLAANNLRVVDIDTRATPDLSVIAAIPAELRDRAVDASAFAVTIGGRAVPAAVEALPPDQLTVGIVVDTAEGVDPDSFLAEQGGAVELVLQLDPRTPVVIGTTAAGAVFGPSSDRRAALLAIQQLAPGGARRPVASLTSVLDASGGGRRALLLVSVLPDASDEESATLAARLTDERTSLVWLSRTAGSGPPAGLAATATELPADGERLLAALDSAAADLVGQFRLRFRVDRPGEVAIGLTSDGQTWTTPVEGVSLEPSPPTTAAPPPDATEPPPVTSAAPVPTAAPATTVAAGAPASGVPTTLPPAADEEVAAPADDSSSGGPDVAVLGVLGVLLALLVAGLAVARIRRRRTATAVAVAEQRADETLVVGGAPPPRYYDGVEFHDFAGDFSDRETPSDPEPSAPEPSAPAARTADLPAHRSALTAAPQAPPAPIPSRVPDIPTLPAPVAAGLPFAAAEPEVPAAHHEVVEHTTDAAAAEVTAGAGALMTDAAAAEETAGAGAATAGRFAAAARLSRGRTSGGDRPRRPSTRGTAIARTVPAALVPDDVPEVSRASPPGERVEDRAEAVPAPTLPPPPPAAPPVAAGPPAPPLVARAPADREPVPAPAPTHGPPAAPSAPARAPAGAAAPADHAVPVPAATDTAAPPTAAPAPEPAPPPITQPTDHAPPATHTAAPPTAAPLPEPAPAPTAQPADHTPAAPTTAAPPTVAPPPEPAPTPTAPPTDHAPPATHTAAPPTAAPPPEPAPAPITQPAEQAVALVADPADRATTVPAIAVPTALNGLGSGGERTAAQPAEGDALPVRPSGPYRTSALPPRVSDAQVHPAGSYRRTPAR